MKFLGTRKSGRDFPGENMGRNGRRKRNVANALETEKMNEKSTIYRSQHCNSQYNSLVSLFVHITHFKITNLVGLMSLESTATNPLYSEGIMAPLIKTYAHQIIN